MIVISSHGRKPWNGRGVFTRKRKNFPKSETFGLRMQLRRSAVNIASHIADAHGRLNDAEMRKGLGSARAALDELETQAELAGSLRFFPDSASDELFALASEVGRLINGLIGVLDPDSR